MQHACACIASRPADRPTFFALVAGRRRVGLFAVGKAAAGMARAALRTIPGAPALVVLPPGDAGLIDRDRLLRDVRRIIFENSVLDLLETAR